MKYELEEGNNLNSYCSTFQKTSNKYINVTIIFLCIIIVIVKNNYRERTTCLKTFLAHLFKQTKTLVN